MFHTMTDITKTRDIFGSLMFFVGMSIILLGVTTLAGHVIGALGVGDSVTGVLGGMGVSTLIGTLFILVSGGSILHHKKLSSDTLSIIILLTGVYLAYSTSVFLGLLLVSYLTTVQSK